MNDAFIRHDEARSETPVRYAACGLDGIYLMNGFEVIERDGVQFMDIRDRENLHVAIAEHLVVNRKVLAPKEIRFIRETMDFSQRELAEELGTTSQSIARWEKGQSGMDGAADRMLRIRFLVSRLTPEQLTEWIKSLTEALERMHEGRDPEVSFDHNNDNGLWTQRERLAA